MAVTKTPTEARVQLKLQTGVDSTGKPVFKVRTFSGVKPTATDQDCYEVAAAVAGLQTLPLNAVFRVDEAELANV